MNVGQRFAWGVLKLLGQARDPLPTHPVGARLKDVPIYDMGVTPDSPVDIKFDGEEWKQVPDEPVADSGDEPVTYRTVVDWPVGNPNMNYPYYPWSAGDAALRETARRAMKAWGLDPIGSSTEQTADSP